MLATQKNLFQASSM